MNKLLKGFDRLKIPREQIELEYFYDLRSSIWHYRETEKEINKKNDLIVEDSFDSESEEYSAFNSEQKSKQANSPQEQKLAALKLNPVSGLRQDFSVIQSKPLESHLKFSLTVLASHRKSHLER